MSKILVTGGAGFVGTNLIIQLQKLGHDVVSIDNYSIGRKNNHQSGVNYIEGDVNDIFELIQNDFDILTSGRTSVQLSSSNTIIGDP